MNVEKTILKVQSEIETALQRLPALAAKLPDELKPLERLAPPKGTHAQVSLRHARTGRQIKRNAPAENWSPDSGVVSISYNISTKEAEALATPAAGPSQNDASPQPAHGGDPVQDLVLALAKAENDPQLHFVSLKWFRDTYLQPLGYAWAATPEKRKDALVEAINRKWVLTSKVVNPKNPQFPVTAIKVNRTLAEVRKILGQAAGFRSGFVPIAMAGEPLSETVLRERR